MNVMGVVWANRSMFRKVAPIPSRVINFYMTQWHHISSVYYCHINYMPRIPSHLVASGTLRSICRTVSENQGRLASMSVTARPVPSDEKASSTSATCNTPPGRSEPTGSSPAGETSGPADLNLPSLICFCCCETDNGYEVDQFYKTKQKKVMISRIIFIKLSTALLF